MCGKTVVKQDVVALGGHGVVEDAVADFEEAAEDGEEEIVEKRYLQKI